jgi:hypothetical protein
MNPKPSRVARSWVVVSGTGAFGKPSPYESPRAAMFRVPPSSKIEVVVA